MQLLAQQPTRELLHQVECARLTKLSQYLLEFKQLLIHNSGEGDKALHNVLIFLGTLVLEVSSLVCQYVPWCIDRILASTDRSFPDMQKTYT